MTFEDACDRLPDYLAGELAPVDRVELERQLAANPELRKMLKFSQHLDGVLQHSVVANAVRRFYGEGDVQN